MLPSKSYKALLAALQRAETIVPRPDQSSSGDDWSLYLRLLKLLSSVQTLHRKAIRAEADKKRPGKDRGRLVAPSA
jgi:hypothetical protein